MRGGRGGMGGGKIIVKYNKKRKRPIYAVSIWQLKMWRRNKKEEVFIDSYFFVVQKLVDTDSFFIIYPSLIKTWSYHV